MAPIKGPVSCEFSSFDTCGFPRIAQRDVGARRACSTMPILPLLKAPTERPAPDHSGKTDLLLRFFDSHFFDEWIALTYDGRCSLSAASRQACCFLRAFQWVATKPLSACAVAGTCTRAIRRGCRTICAIACMGCRRPALNDTCCSSCNWWCCGRTALWSASLSICAHGPYGWPSRLDELTASH